MCLLIQNFKFSATLNIKFKFYLIVQLILKNFESMNDLSDTKF